MGGAPRPLWPQGKKIFEGQKAKMKRHGGREILALM